jgi:hypothetical protein
VDQTEEAKKEEETIINHQQQNFIPLVPVGERSKGIVYSDSMHSTWTLPRYLQLMSERYCFVIFD